METNKNEGTIQIDNFAKLIVNKNILVPIIQRDYAQGRRIDPVNSIRKGMIESLFKAVREGEVMDINFIYGINKENDDFLPIDGQQRITSIFLFLWFCAVKGNKTKEFCGSRKVKNFSYMLRDTSIAFFDALQEKKDGDLLYREDFEQYVNTENASLRNCYWFRYEWENDITIDGAVTFLDSIKEYWKSLSKGGSLAATEFGEYFDKLLDPDKCPIRLIFIVQNEQQSAKLDQKEREKASFEAENRAAVTYINMNERGKLLNEFENLKALIYKGSERAKQFIKNYDDKYIHVFHEIMNKNIFGKKNMTLSQKVSKMDEMTRHFILNIVNDQEVLLHNASKKMEYYDFMRNLRDKKLVFDDPSFPLFDFMEYLLGSYSQFTQDEKNIFQLYCDERTVKHRYLFYLTFWEKYRGIDRENYWQDYFKKHLKFDAFVDISEEKPFKYLVKLINELAVQKTQQQFLIEIMAAMDVNEFHAKVTEAGRDYSYLIDKATLQEEKLKAAVIKAFETKVLAGYVKDAVSRMEMCGQRHGAEQRDKIRYLFYLSGIWKGAVNQVSWNQFVKYDNVDQAVYPLTSDLKWEKIYYLAALSKKGMNLLDENMLPPSDTDAEVLLKDRQVIRTWDMDWLVWENEDPDPDQRARLDMTKVCYDLIIAEEYPNPDPSLLVKAYCNKVNKTNSWLYYLLHRSYLVLLSNDVYMENKTTFIEAERFDKRKANFYEYVLCEDMLSKDSTCSFRLGEYAMSTRTILLEQQVAHREDDNYKTNKNMEVELRVIYEITETGYIYHQKNTSVYRFRFAGFDANQEDTFLFEEDQMTVGQFASDVKRYETQIGALVASMKANYYDWVFRGDCASLKQGIKGIGISCTCEKEGQRTIVITIREQVKFQVNRSDSQITHETLLKKF